MSRIHTVTNAPWVNALKSALRRVAGRTDLDAVHDLRVALARLSVWLRLSGYHVLREDVRWLRHAAAQVRDIDVRLDFLPPPAEAKRLKEERTRHQRKLKETVRGPRVAALTFALEGLPATSKTEFEKRAQRLVKKAKALSHGVWPSDFPSLHSMRSAVRKLRYALEWLGQDAGKVETLQTTLGEVCDCTLALGGAKDPTSSGEIQIRRDEAEQRAKSEWKTLRPKLPKLL